jgi:hypothetical protein
MASPIFLTGFEQGIISASGGGLFDSVTNAPTIDATIKRTGSYSLRAYKTVASSCHVTKNIAGSPTYLVARFYIYFTTLPSSSTTIWRCNANTGGGPSISFIQATSQLRSDFNGSGNQLGPVITTGQWYRIDLRAYVGGATRTQEWSVDGVAQTTSSDSIAASYFTNIRAGFIDAITGDLYFDDIVASITSGDYPLGGTDEVEIVGLRPGSDGTHNNAANIMEDSAGNDIDGSTYYAYDKLDENPWATTADADYVRQTGNGTGNYCEVNFADTAETTILGARAFLQYASASTSGNTGGCIMIDEDAVSTTLYGAAGALADYSETSAFYKSVMMPTPAGGWDAAAVNAIKCRFGYSDDAAPDPYWLALMLEVAYVKATGYTLACAGGSYAVTGTAVTPKRDGKIVPEAGSYALTGQAAGAYYGRAIDADAGAYSLSGADVTLPRTFKIIPEAGAYALTGQALSPLKGSKIVPDAGSYVLTGAEAAALYGRAIDADAGAYLVTGQAASLLRAARLALDAGAYVLTGQAVTLTYVPGGGAYLLSCEGGTYAITGADAGLLRAAKIAVESGIYTMTGQAATLTYVPGVAAYILSCEGGNYAIVGGDAGLLRDASIAAEGGAYTLTGQAAATLLDRLVSAGAGAYAIDGKAATLVYSAQGQYTLVCEGGSYVITGAAAAMLKHILHPDTVYVKAPERTAEVDSPKRTAVVGEKYKATVSRRRTWN